MFHNWKFGQRTNIFPPQVTTAPTHNFINNLVLTVHEQPAVDSVYWDAGYHAKPGVVEFGMNGEPNTMVYGVTVSKRFSHIRIAMLQ
jgi:hypothetical protein